MTGTSSPSTISTKLQQVAELAKGAPELVFTTLAHHIDIEWLREAYRRTRKDGATGVDGQTAEEYAEHLEENLQLLLDRLQSGTYRAPAVRRAYIPKGDGRKLRPLGIPTFEDKVLQRAVAMLLTAVYEQDFLDCSYGFRPKRSAHQALEVLWKRLMDMKGAVVIDLDIQGYFDTVEHAQLRRILDQRVRDGVLRRTIDKWLHAGVLEDGALRYPEAGTPQGGVISPVLANVYLHEVLDQWFAVIVKPRLEGDAFLIRYADDAVLVFASERDARRVLAVLPKRFGRYGLTLHPEKTRLIDFRQPRTSRGRRGERPGSFALLGFTHYWGRSHRGRWVVKRKTASERLTRAIKAVRQWCRAHRHEPIAEQQKVLGQKVRGHCRYYGITGNAGALGCFHNAVVRAWRTWLARRAQQRHMPWERFKRLLQRYPLPPPVAFHSVARAAARPCA